MRGAGQGEGAAGSDHQPAGVAKGRGGRTVSQLFVSPQGQVHGPIRFWIQDLLEMAPTEVLCQSRDLSLLRPSLAKSDHVEQLLATVAGAVFSRQLSRQCRDNRIAVLRARAPRISRRVLFPIFQKSITSSELTVRATRTRASSIRLRRSAANSPRIRGPGTGCSGRLARLYYSSAVPLTNPTRTGSL